MKRAEKKQSFSLSNYLATAGSGRAIIDFDFEAGHVVFSQGQAADSVYLVPRGDLTMLLNCAVWVKPVLETRPTNRTDNSDHCCSATLDESPARGYPLVL